MGRKIRLGAAAAQLSGRLFGLADSVAVDPSLAQDIQNDVRRLLETHYTMESERVVHRLFAEDGADDDSVTPTSGGADEVVFFF